MDKIHAASEVPFPRGSRTSDFPSYDGDYASPCGYPSSLSVYNAFDTKPISRDGYGLAGGFSDPLSRDGLGFKESHTEPLSNDGYGGYSYSSSYDDMRKSAYEGWHSYSRQFENIKSLEASVDGKYEYGTDKGSSFHVADKGPSFASYYKSLPSFDRSLASSSPLTSSLYGEDGQKSQHRYHDLSHQGTADSYQTQYNYLGLNNSDFTSLNKSDTAFLPNDTISNFQHPYRTPQVGLTGVAADYQQASGLSRKYDSNLPGTHPTFAALGDWRNAGGKLYSSDENGWQGPGTYSSNFNKFGLWDGGVVKQVQPEIEQKGNITSLPLVSGSKIVNCNEGTMQTLGVDLGREAMFKKKRQSRWEPVDENEKNGQDGSEKKKKKSRWSEEKPCTKEVNFTDLLKGDGSDLVALRAQLIFINKKLQSGQVLDDRPEAERSPSPEPVFDNFGYRVNTREFRARERLTKERQRIIARLSEKSSSFKPPPDFKQPKFSKKLFIPADEYPEYNFIGLIIGPRGHTQKKMEKESGAKIFIRGKGSVREGSSTLTLFNESENLHVLIEADTEESVNMAAGMVEKLLVPVEDGENEHKKAQLRELATLNGTLRSGESCHVCKEVGHVAKDCPRAASAADSSAVGVYKGDTSQDMEHCHVCKGHGHLSKDCPSTSGSLLKGGSLASGGHQVTGLDSYLSNEGDKTLLYVAFLPLSVNDAHLQSLFSPFGQVVHSKVMRHLTTGISKSYGFVKFLDAADAAQAVALMNGYKLDGKVLLVKLKTNAEAAS